MSDDLDTTSPLSCSITTHCVGNFDSWLGGFKGNSEMHTGTLKAKYSMAGKCSEKIDGKDVSVGLHIFPSAQEDVVTKVFQFDGPPFVGGPDLIKNGAVAPPFSTFQFKVRATRNHVGTEDDGPLMAVIVSHAVNNFEEWYTKGFKPANADENMESMGIVKSIAGQGPDAAGKPTAVTIHYFKKENEAKIREFFTMKGPPFVGGPDLIKSGLVIPPLINEIYASVEHKETY